MFNEFIDGIKTDMVDEIVLGTTSLGLGVDTTVVVLAISTTRRKGERQRER